MRIQVPVNWVWIGLDQVLDHTFSSTIIVIELGGLPRLEQKRVSDSSSGDTRFLKSVREIITLLIEVDLQKWL